MRMRAGLLLAMLLVSAGLAGCAGRPHAVRNATVSSAKAVGKGTVWVTKKTGQGVVYVAKAGTNAVKSIGKKDVADPDTLVQVGDQPLDEGKASLIEQEVAERESGELVIANAKGSEKTADSAPADDSGWTTKGASGSVLASERDDTPLSSNSSDSGGIRHDLPELDIDASLAAAEGRSTKTR